MTYRQYRCKNRYPVGWSPLIQHFWVKSHYGCVSGCWPTNTEQNWLYVTDPVYSLRLAKGPQLLEQGCEVLKGNTLSAPPRTVIKDLSLRSNGIPEN